MPVTTNIFRSWRRPRAVMRSLLNMGQREDRAIAYLMAGCGVTFVAQWPRLAREAHLDTAIPLDALIQEALVAWIFVMPLVAYVLALVLFAILRFVLPGLTAYGARLALFWTLLASTPASLLYGLMAGFLGPETGGATLAGAVLAGGFLFILIQSFREAGQEGAHV